MRDNPPACGLGEVLRTPHRKNLSSNKGPRIKLILRFNLSNEIDVARDGFENGDVGARTGSIWIRIGTRGGLL